LPEKIWHSLRKSGKGAKEAMIPVLINVFFNKESFQQVLLKKNGIFFNKE